MRVYRMLQKIVYKDSGMIEEVKRTFYMVNLVDPFEYRSLTARVDRLVI